MKVGEVVIGKRVSIGMAINGVAAALAHFYPQHAPAIVAIAAPLTFAIQVFVANKFGITS